MNHATKAFFSSGRGIVLAVYDTRRGQQEGREAEKILAFYPPTAQAAMQSSIIGLAQALTMFAGTFNKECPFHTMEAHNHIWTMYHAEPDLWLLLVVGRGLVGPHCLNSNLASFIKGLHNLSTLLYGLLSTQLQQDSSAVSVKRRLQPLLQEAASSLFHPPDAAGLMSLSSPLSPQGGLPLLPVSPAAFTRLQSLVNSLLVTRLFGVRPVTGVVVCWQPCLLWSSCNSSDTAALHTLAARGLEPAIREGPRHKTIRRPIGSPPGHRQHAVTANSPLQQQQQQPSSSNNTSSHLQPDLICLANPACWYCRPNGQVVPVGPTAATAAPGNASSNSTAVNSSGALPVSTLLPRANTGSTDATAAALPTTFPSSSDVVHGSNTAVGLSAGHLAVQELSRSSSDLPTVWLQSGTETARLMAWHHGPLLLLLLLENSGPVMSSCGDVVSGLLDVVSGPGAVLSAQLSAELPAKHLWHVKGLRYQYQDHLSAAVRASPLRKVATLSQSSMHLTADTRSAAALEAAAAADPTAPALGQDASAAGGSSSSSHPLTGYSLSRAVGDSSALRDQWESFAAGGSDADVEVVIKGGNDCWVVARHTTAGRQLTAVVEGDKDRGVLGVMRRVQAFCDHEVPGVFEGLA